MPFKVPFSFRRKEANRDKGTTLNRFAVELIDVLNKIDDPELKVAYLTEQLCAARTYELIDLDDLIREHGGVTSGTQFIFKPNP